MKQIVLILSFIAIMVLAGLGLTRLDAPTPPPEPTPTVWEPMQQSEPEASTAQPATREREIESRLAAMSLADKVGQVFFARCPEGNEAEQAAQYQLGGYILFARDFAGRTPDSLRDLLAECNQATKTPMLFGADEEGGTVVRISRYTQYAEQKFKSPQQVYRAGGMDAIRADASEKAVLLKDLGINVNFAPVCDVSTDPNDYMYDRSFGKDADETAEFVRAVVQESAKQGVGTVLKHFPGYGNNADTHGNSIVRDEREKAVFEQSDFLPFSAGINAGADAVLLSHNIVEAFDAEQPASLSAAVQAVLRREMGFTRVSLTDDLAMGALTQAVGGDEGKAAVLAVQAGNDMLLSSDVETQYAAVLDAVQRGEIEESRIDEAVRRVLGWKYDIGLLSAE